MAFEYEQVILHWVNRLSFLSRRELQSRFASRGEKIGSEEWAVLILLWRRDGWLPSALADATTRDRTTMTRLIDGMVKKGLVTRKPDKQDRRRVNIHLTARGKALEVILVPAARTLIGDAVEGLDAAEIEIALKVLQRMTGNLLASGDAG